MNLEYQQQQQLQKQIFDFLTAIKNVNVRYNYTPKATNSNTKARYGVVCYNDILWSDYAYKLANLCVKRYTHILTNIFDCVSYFYADNKTTNCEPICCYISDYDYKGSVRLSWSKSRRDTFPTYYYEFYKKQFATQQRNSDSTRLSMKKSYKYVCGDGIVIKVIDDTILDILCAVGVMDRKSGIVTTAIANKQTKKRERVFYVPTKYGLQYVSLNDIVTDHFVYHISDMLKNVYSLVGHYDHKHRLLTQSKITASVCYFIQCAKHNNEILRIQHSGRRTTRLTNLTNYMWSFVTDIDGKHFIEIDGKNTQPILLACLFKQNGILARQYTEDCESGVFYERIIDLFCHDTTIYENNTRYCDILTDKQKNGVYVDRNKAKTFVYRHIFFATAYTPTNKYILSRIAERYGQSVCDYLANAQKLSQRTKRIEQTNKDISIKESHLWWQLQHLESVIWNDIYDSVCDDNDIQIYDAILTTNNSKALRIQKQYNDKLREFGIQAMTTLVYLTKENVFDKLLDTAPLLELRPYEIDKKQKQHDYFAHIEQYEQTAFAY